MGYCFLQSVFGILKMLALQGHGDEIPKTTGCPGFSLCFWTALNQDSWSISVKLWFCALQVFCLQQAAKFLIVLLNGI